jgi:hypothetical protein
VTYWYASTILVVPQTPLRLSEVLRQEGDAGKSAAIRNLHNAAKIAIAAAVKLVSTSRAMAPSMVDKKTAHDVSSKADKVRT